MPSSNLWTEDNEVMSGERENFLRLGPLNVCISFLLVSNSIFSPGRRVFSSGRTNCVAPGETTDPSDKIHSVSAVALTVYSIERSS